MAIKSIPGIKRTLLLMTVVEALWIVVCYVAMAGTSVYLETLFPNIQHPIAASTCLIYFWLVNLLWGVNVAKAVVTATIAGAV